MVNQVKATVYEEKKVEVEQLAMRYDYTLFPFKTTDELNGIRSEIIGQDRAVKAMEFGLSIKNEGYNLFLVGPSGTGKTTYARSKVLEVAKSEASPLDWVYVNNFQHADRPIAISFPAGEATPFQKKMAELIREIESEIEKVFSGKQYEQEKVQLLQNHDDFMNEKWDLLEEFALKQSFHLEQTEQGIMAIPIDEHGEPYEDDEYRKLSQEKHQEIIEKTKILNKEVTTFSRESQALERDLKKQLKNLEEQTVLYAIQPLIDVLKREYEHHAEVIAHLDALEKDIVERWESFDNEPTEEADGLMSLLMDRDQKREEHRYDVNVFIDNSEKTGAPVIFESNPTYSNLFGKFEYKSAFGTVVTDFTMIKSGALHQANGGYIIIQAADLLSHPLSWHALKRMLKTGELRIESMLEETGLNVASGMKPEPIPIQLKVILIGTYEIYHLLSQYDEDFRKFFKVKVDFDTEMARNEEHCLKYAAFVASYCKKENLRHLTGQALGKVIDYSTRLSNDQRKLSTCFHEITEILVEANYWAEKAGSDYVEAEHVGLALQERFYRSSLIEEKIKESIEEGTIMISTDGEAVGQINGLSVLDIGDYTFGQPNKITARTFIGSKGIVNIDRESSLSGPLHSKGLLILSGYLQGEFAKNGPIPLSASITFEQSYGMVDGDSASSTELYAILSSLANVPIRQGIAVTGSVNQLGEIQPIGGVNEKIEGFFYTCRARGLTGEQGVIIPWQNVKNLMLRNEVIEAVKQGEFSIWAIKTIQEGIEILTGLEAGERNEKGEFPKGSVLGLVEARIDEMIQSFRQRKKN